MKKVSKTIWVNPVPRVSVQGRHNQVYTMNMSLITADGGLVPSKRMNKNKEGSAAETFQFMTDPYRMRLITGLDKIVSNPFAELDVQDLLTTYNLKEDWRDILNVIVTKESINKQTLFEIKHGVSPNFYTSDIKYFMGNMPQDMSLFDKDRTYLQDVKLILYDRPNPFDDATPRQELLMEMVYNTPKIALNKQDINPALHNWYISLENEEESEVAKKKELIEEAIYNLYKLKHDYGAFRAYQMSVILLDRYGQPLVKGKVTPDVVSTKLNNYITTSSQFQFENITSFMKKMKMLNSKDEFDKFYITYLVQQALNTNVLAYRDNQYIWHSKAGTPDVYTLGTSFEKLINFFLKEYSVYNKKSDVTNWYKDLENEVRTKGVQLDE